MTSKQAIMILRQRLASSASASLTSLFGQAAKAKLSRRVLHPYLPSFVNPQLPNRNRSYSFLRSCASMLVAASVMAVLPAKPVLAEDVFVTASAEMGFLRALRHTIQIGEGTHELDYVREGGQEILLPYSRFEVVAELGARHEVAFLYQPLTLATFTRVDRPGGITIDDVTFADDTPLNLRYGFDFYRLTYRYGVLDTERWRLSVGAGLQLRNASIIFDGFDTEGNEARAITQDLGPVPVISVAFGRAFAGGRFIDATMEGFYAPVRYLNLRDVDVVGWLYDVSVRAGVPLTRWGEAYVMTRFLGGGAEGTAGERRYWTQARREPRFTSNTLDILIFGLGVRLILPERGA